MKLNDTTALMTAAILAALAICMLACGCGGTPIESDPTVDPPSGPSSTKDPLVGTWVRGDGYTMELRDDGTAEIAGEALTWYAYETAGGVQVLDVLRGPVQYPATYSLSAGVLTIGTDGPLQEGDYVRASAQ